MEGLKPQAQALAALLTLTSLWPERFSAGLVPVDQIPQFTDRIASNAATIRQALHRAENQFAAMGSALKTTARSVGRKRGLGLVAHPPPWLEQWLFDTGRHLLSEGLWRDFVASRIQPPATPSDAVQGLTDTIARVLIIRGEKERAFGLLDKALGEDSDRRRLVSLQLTRAMALVRRGNSGDWEEAYKVLADLVLQPLPHIDIHDRLLEARLWVEYVYCHYVLNIRAAKDLDFIEDEITRCRMWLEKARALEAGLSPGDRARLINVEALLKKKEAGSADSSEREAMFDEAERDFLKAFSLHQTVWDSYGMGAALYNLGELNYVRYQLQRGEASEEQVLRALDWYRASVRLGDELETNRDFVLDYARVADTIGLLIVARHAAGRRDGLDKLLRDAEQHLAIARTHGSPIEQQLVQWVDLRLDECARRAHLDRRPTGSAAWPATEER